MKFVFDWVDLRNIYKTLFTLPVTPQPKAQPFTWLVIMTRQPLTVRILSRFNLNGMFTVQDLTAALVSSKAWSIVMNLLAKIQFFPN